jgi:hypothetical protein
LPARPLPVAQRAGQLDAARAGQLGAEVKVRVDVLQPRPGVRATRKQSCQIGEMLLFGQFLSQNMPKY